MPQFAANSNQTFDDQDLTLTLDWKRDSNESYFAPLRRGEADACFTPLRAWLREISTNGALPAKFAFMSSTSSHLAVVSLSESGIHSPGDLQDANYAGLDPVHPAEPRSNYARFLLELTREYQHFTEVQRIKKGSLINVAYDELPSSLASGKADVAALWLDSIPDFAARMREVHGCDVSYLPMGTSESHRIYSAGFLLRDNVCQDEDFLQCFRTALTNAFEVARTNPEVCAESLVQHVPDIDKKLAIESWETITDHCIYMDDPEFGRMTKAKWEATLVHHATVHGGDRPNPDELFLS